MVIEEKRKEGKKEEKRREERYLSEYMWITMSNKLFEYHQDVNPHVSSRRWYLHYSWSTTF
jgi:hypothetical protein